MARDFIAVLRKAHIVKLMNCVFLGSLLFNVFRQLTAGDLKA